MFPTRQSLMTPMDFGAPPFYPPHPPNNMGFQNAIHHSSQFYPDGPHYPDYPPPPPLMLMQPSYPPPLLPHPSMLHSQQFHHQWSPPPPRVVNALTPHPPQSNPRLQPRAESTCMNNNNTSSYQTSMQKSYSKDRPQTMPMQNSYTNVTSQPMSKTEIVKPEPFRLGGPPQPNPRLQPWAETINNNNVSSHQKSMQKSYTNITSQLMPKTELVKPEPLKPVGLTLSDFIVKKKLKKKTKERESTKARKESTELYQEKQEAYKTFHKFLTDIKVPVKINDPGLTAILLDLPDNLKHVINYQGGYRVFLQQSDEIEVKDGWVEMKQISEEDDGDHGWVWGKKAKKEWKEKDAENSQDKSIMTSRNNATISKGPLKEDGPTRTHPRHLSKYLSHEYSVSTRSLDSSQSSAEIDDSQTQACSPPDIGTCIPLASATDSLAISPFSCPTSELKNSADSDSITLNQKLIYSQETHVLVSQVSPSGSAQLGAEHLQHPSQTGSPDLEMMLCSSLNRGPGPLSHLSSGSPDLKLVQDSISNCSPGLEIVSSPSSISNTGLMLCPSRSSPNLELVPFPSSEGSQGLSLMPCETDNGSTGFVPYPSSSSPTLELVPVPSSNTNPGLVGRPSRSSPTLELIPFPSSMRSESLQMMPYTTTIGSPELMSRPSSTASSGSDLVPVGYLVPVQVDNPIAVSGVSQLVGQPIRFRSLESSENPGPVGDCVPVGYPPLVRSPPPTYRYPSPVQFPSTIDNPVLVLDPRMPQSYGQVLSPVPSGNLRAGDTPVIVEVTKPPATLQFDGPLQFDGQFEAERVPHAILCERQADLIHEEQMHLTLCDSTKNQVQSYHKTLSNHLQFSPSSSYGLDLNSSLPAIESHGHSTHSLLHQEVLQHQEVWQHQEVLLHQEVLPHQEVLQHHNHDHQCLNPHSSVFIPKVTPVDDDDDMETKKLPDESSFDLTVQAYRLLREAVLNKKTLDFTDQDFLNITIQLAQSTRDSIKSMGGFWAFLVKHAEGLHDDKLLDILIPRDRVQEMLDDVVQRSKGTSAEVIEEEKGIMTDPIELTSCLVNAVPETSSCGVDTDDLELLIVTEHSKLTKKLALIKDRFAHEKMKGETFTERNEEDLKGLKEEYNRECARIEELQRNSSDNGGSNLQLQIAKANCKNYGHRLAAVTAVKTRLIQELGQKTTEVLHLEQTIKAEAFGKASIVQLDKSTVTEHGNADENKIDEYKLDSHDRALLKRIQAAEIQMLQIEHERCNQAVQECLDKGKYTYHIFAMDLKISSPEQEWLKAQWTNYEDKAKQYIQTLATMVEQQKHVIESSSTLDDLPDVKLPSMDPFTVLCQVNAGSPSDLHFVVAPPCQSCHSTSNQSIPTDQGLELKVHDKQDNTKVPTKISSAHSRNSDTLSGKTTQEPNQSMGPVPDIVSAMSVTRTADDTRSIPQDHKNNVKHENQPVIAEKLCLPNPSKSSRVLKTANTNNAEEPKHEQPGKIHKQAAEMEDLETLLESCLKLAASLPSNDKNAQSNVVIKDGKVPAPKGLTIPTLIPESSSLKSALSSKQKKLSSIEEECPHYISSSNCNEKHRVADNQEVDKQLSSSVLLQSRNILRYGDQVTDSSRTGHMLKVIPEQVIDPTRTDRVSEVNQVQVIDPSRTGHVTDVISGQVLDPTRTNCVSKVISDQVVDPNRTGCVSKVIPDQVFDPSRAGYMSNVIPSHSSDMHMKSSMLSTQSEITRTITSNTPSQTVSCDRAWLNHVVHMIEEPFKSLQLHNNKHHTDNKIDTNIESKQGLDLENYQQEAAMRQVDAQNRDQDQVHSEVTGCHDSDEMVSKPVHLDVSTTTSSDTGVADCSVSSEQNDLKNCTYNSDVCTVNSGLVFKDNITTLSENERVSVDVSQYKMSERDYLYQDMTEELEAENGDDGSSLLEESITGYLLLDTSINDQDDTKVMLKEQKNVGPETLEDSFTEFMLSDTSINEENDFESVPETPINKQSDLKTVPETPIIEQSDTKMERKEQRNVGPETLEDSFTEYMLSDTSINEENDFESVPETPINKQSDLKTVPETPIIEQSDIKMVRKGQKNVGPAVVVAGIGDTEDLGYLLLKEQRNVGPAKIKADLQKTKDIGYLLCKEQRNFDSELAKPDFQATNVMSYYLRKKQRNFDPEEAKPDIQESKDLGSLSRKGRKNVGPAVVKPDIQETKDTGYLSRKEQRNFDSEIAKPDVQETKDMGYLLQKEQRNFGPAEFKAEIQDTKGQGTLLRKGQRNVGPAVTKPEIQETKDLGSLLRKKQSIFNPAEAKPDLQENKDLGSLSQKGQRNVGSAVAKPEIQETKDMGYLLRKEQRNFDLEVAKLNIQETKDLGSWLRKGQRNVGPAKVATVIQENKDLGSLSQKGQRNVGSAVAKPEIQETKDTGYLLRKEQRNFDLEVAKLDIQETKDLGSWLRKGQRNVGPAEVAAGIQNTKDLDSLSRKRQSPAEVKPEIQEAKDLGSISQKGQRNVGPGVVKPEICDTKDLGSLSRKRRRNVVPGVVKPEIKETKDLSYLSQKGQRNDGPGVVKPEIKEYKDLGSLLRKGQGNVGVAKPEIKETKDLGSLFLPAFAARDDVNDVKVEEKEESISDKFLPMWLK